MDSFDASIFKALLTKRYWSEYQDVITQELFTASLLKALYAHIETLHNNTQNDIDIETLRIDIQATYNEATERRHELLDQCNSIANAPAVEDHALKEAIRKFGQREHSLHAVNAILASVHKDNFDPSVAANHLARAVELGEKIRSSVTTYGAAGLPGTANERTNITSFGFCGPLDDLLGGGLGAGELCLFLAPPKRGKTSYLCAVGAHAAKIGKHVLHVTLEIPTWRVVRRYDSSFTGRRNAELIADINKIIDTRKRYADRIYVQDWSYVPTTPSNIKGLVRRMWSQDIGIDVLVVDYLGKVKPNPVLGAYRREVRHQLGEMVNDMRAVAISLGIPTFSAWQINREGSRVETVGGEHIAECWDAIAHADLVLGLNQNAEELSNRVMRLSVLYQRESTDRPVYTLHSDLDRMIIHELGEHEDEVTDYNI